MPDSTIAVRQNIKLSKWRFRGHSFGIPDAHSRWKFDLAGCASLGLPSLTLTLTAFTEKDGEARGRVCWLVGAEILTSESNSINNHGISSVSTDEGQNRHREVPDAG